MAAFVAEVRTFVSRPNCGTDYVLLTYIPLKSFSISAAVTPPVCTVKFLPAAMLRLQSPHSPGGDFAGSSEQTEKHLPKTSPSSYSHVSLESLARCSGEAGNLLRRWKGKSGPQLLVDSPGGRKPKPSWGGVHAGRPALHDLPGLEKLKVASGWKVGRAGRSSRRKTYKEKQGTGREWGEAAFVQVWSSPPPATGRKGGDSMFWK